MIDLYYWTTPNGHKITIFLEEAELAYNTIPIHIGRGEQFTPEFLAIAPNNRIPAIVDHQPNGNHPPLPIFESGAILLYLAEKTNRYLPDTLPERTAVIQWLMWQMGGLGPMLGQNHHFRTYAPEPIPYAIKRYEQEAHRLYSVLNKQLENRDYICDHYSIADMACYPWVVPFDRQGIDLADFPQVKRWMDTMQNRPAVARAYAIAQDINTQPTVDKAAQKILFGQTDTKAPNV